MQLGTLVGMSSFVEHMVYAITLFTDETTLGELLDALVFQEFYSDKRSEDHWYIRMKLTKQWADAVNKHGSNAKVVLLQEINIQGSPYFLMYDLNNDKITDLMVD